MTQPILHFSTERQLLRLFNHHPLTRDRYDCKEIVDQRLAQAFHRAELSRAGMYLTFFYVFAASSDISSLPKITQMTLLRNYIPVLKENATGDLHRTPLRGRELRRILDLLV